MSDPRFARLHTDPRFVRPKANKHKVVVDERFKQLFDGTDGSAGKGHRARKVDKYGRPLAKEASVNELKRYYRLASPEAEALKKGEVDSDEAQDGEEEEEDEEEGSEEEEEEEGGKAAPAKGFMDLARGEGLLESSDEEEAGSDEDEALASDAESTSSSADGAVTLGGRAARKRREARSPSIDLSETEVTAFPDEEDEEEGEEADEAPDAEPTRRIALVNLDWDHLRASDLYRVLSSCISSTASSSSVVPQKVPAKGKVKFDADGNEVEEYKPSAKLSIAKGRLLSLRIYPSQYGRERMEREAIEGPPAAVLKAKGAESDEEDEGELRLGAKKKNKGKGKKRAGAEESDDEFTQQDLVDEQLQDGEDDYDTEALRQYQLERLRYYYAIATFDTVAAAEHVFQEIHGSEFERTANIFDLQFVPDETSFDDDPVHDEATEASIAAEGNSYTGLDFSTDALRHSKVKLTWDADDPHRKTKMQTYLAAALDRSKQKGATKGKAAVGDADIEQYLASSSGEEDDEAAEEGEEEADDFFEAPAEEDEPKKGKKKESKRDRMRALLGLGDDGGLAGEDDLSWDGGKKEKKGGDGGMQITFAPALSERSAKQLEFAGEEKQESSLERYKRKEKERKERKKAERKARAEGRLGDDEGEFSPGSAPGANGDGADDAGFDDDFFADDGADPFAAYDGGAGDSGDEIGLKKNAGKKQSKKDKKAQREAEDAANAKEQAELALLVGSDDEDDVLGAGGEGGRHFDMRQILKAEKAGGKKVKKGKGKGKKALAKEEAEKVNDEFKIDVKDDRFKSLHEDFDFAIDPSNPRYQKSRNMEALLAEGRKRRSTKTSKVRAPVAPADGKAPAKRSLEAGGAEEGESLSKLVEAVKRKAGETGGRGKRTKTV
ncbi:hypothetical protein JCM11251_007487 [Rhodosporidiobolus azoricus]